MFIQTTGTFPQQPPTHTHPTPSLTSAARINPTSIQCVCDASGGTSDGIVGRYVGDCAGVSTGEDQFDADGVN